MLAIHGVIGAALAVPLIGSESVLLALARHSRILAERQVILGADHRAAAIADQARRESVGMIVAQHAALIPRHHAAASINILADERPGAAVVLRYHLPAFPHVMRRRSATDLLQPPVARIIGV